jgi:hypothetical protein
MLRPYDFVILTDRLPINPNNSIAQSTERLLLRIDAVTLTPCYTERTLLCSKALPEVNMLAELMIKPSSLISTGIEVESFGSSYLFRFNDQLQERMESLLEKSKQDSLTIDETTEWAGIKELSRIFTFINAELAIKAQWCPAQIDNSSANEANSAANTAIPQNI